MTVLVTLERAKLDAVVTVPPEVTGVGESTIFLQVGERIPVRDLIEAALIPSANDAADALAYYVGRGSQERFVAMMNAKARRLRPEGHALRSAGRSRRPGHVSERPRRHHSSRGSHAPSRGAPDRPRHERGHRGGRTIYTRNALLYSFPGLIGVKTGHTGLAGWSEVAPPAAERGDHLRHHPRVALGGAAGRRSRTASHVGFSQYRRATLVAAGAPYAQAATGFGRGPVDLVAKRPLVAARSGRPAARREGHRPTDARPARERGQAVGQVRIYAAGRLLGARAHSWRRGRSLAPGLVDRTGWYIGRTFSNLFGWM